MMLGTESSDDNNIQSLHGPVVGQCSQSINDSIDTDSESNKNMLSIPQVSFASLSIGDDERDGSPSNKLRKESITSTSEEILVCCRSSSKLSVVTNNVDTDDNEDLAENEINHHSPDNNSLIDDMEDDQSEDEIHVISLTPPPPPPPPPPRHQQRRKHNQQQQPHKFLLRQSIPATISTQRIPIRRLNRISLHIYDLISSDALMQLPWGCVCEIGKCFNEVNSALHELGTGAYHVGIECNGIEYAYGACSQPNKTGVFSCIPKLSPGYQYRSSIDFGYLPLIRSSWIMQPPTTPNCANDTTDPTCTTTSPRSVTSTSTNNFQYQEEFVDGRLVIKEMAAEYMGIEYDILKRNCCTFSADACVRLGVPEEDVPTWFRNLAETGAYSHTNFVEPLQHVLSGVTVNPPVTATNAGTVSSPSAASLNGHHHNFPSTKRYKNSFHEQQYSHCTPSHHPNLVEQEYNGYSSSIYYGSDNSNNNNSSGCGNYNNNHTNTSEPGFEVIAQRNASNTRDVVVVVDASATDTTPTDRRRQQQLRSYRTSASVY